jgi:putative redox protein
MDQPYQVKVSLRDGMHFEARTNDPDSEAFSIQLDSAPELGGQGKGLRPAKMLLVSLAACMAMDVVSILRKKQQRISGFEAYVTSHRAHEYPKVYTDIQVTFSITGKSVDKAAVERAIELSYDKYCPIANMLKPVVPIATRFEIMEG